MERESRGAYSRKCNVERGKMYFSNLGEGQYHVFPICSMKISRKLFFKILGILPLPRNLAPHYNITVLMTGREW
jgi:CTP-dependent riboflavin kinase